MFGIVGQMFRSIVELLFTDQELRHDLFPQITEVDEGTTPAVHAVCHADLTKFNPRLRTISHLMASEPSRRSSAHSRKRSHSEGSHGDQGST